MANVTVSLTDKGVSGDRLVRRGTMTFTSGYTNAGETITPALCELSELKWLSVGAPSIDDVPLASALVTALTPSSATVKAVDDAGILEGTTDLSSTTLDFIAYGV